MACHSQAGGTRGLEPAVGRMIYDLAEKVGETHTSVWASRAMGERGICLMSWWL